MGLYRHDLLVAMKLVNTIEQETMRAEWEHWVMEEAERCDKTGELVLGERGANSSSSNRTGAASDVHEDLQRYCSSCKEAKRQLSSL